MSTVVTNANYLSVADVGACTDRSLLSAVHLFAWRNNDLETQVRVINRLAQLDGATIRRMRDRRDDFQKDHDEERTGEMR